MTEQQPPAYLSAGCYTAAQDRAVYDSLICQQGIDSTNSTNSLKVQDSASAGMFVDILAGGAWIEGDVGFGSGMYYVYNDATVTKALPSADPTLVTNVRVVARVYDSSVSGALDEWRIEVISAAAGDPLPAEPANSLTLATIAIPAGGTDTQAAWITDTRTHYELCAGATPTMTFTTQTFIADGTWNKPTGLVYARVRVQAAGGGGGGAAATAAGQQSMGSGGGGGEYAEQIYAASSLTASVAVTVGAGGAAGLAAAGGTGGDSSFGALITAVGGAGGASNAAATPNADWGNPAAGGSGGTGTALFRVRGRSGHSSGRASAATAAPSPGIGGSSHLGSGGMTTIDNHGVGGVQGGGGSGTAQRQSLGGKNGGAGGGGLVIVENYLLLQ